MIVALDGSPSILSSGGLRRYTEELVRAMRLEFPDHQFRLLPDQQTMPRNWIERRWWLLGLPLHLRRLGCHIFHGTDFAVPYLPLRPSVVTVHDLSPWMDRNWHSSADRVRRRTPLLLKLGIATAIITPTEAVRKQLLDRFRVPAERVFAVHEAAGERMVPCEPWPGSYFLFVGTLEPRKNVPALVRAWRHVRKRHPQVDLLIAGRVREDAPYIEPEPGLHLLGEVQDADLPAIYSGAIALVYPSAYEGFGLPLVEAMQCGCAVITSLDPALKEVSGGAAIHIEPDRLAEPMQLLLENTEELGRRRELGRLRARQFSWRKAARETMEVYAEAIRRF